MTTSARKEEGQIERVWEGLVGRVEGRRAAFPSDETNNST